MIALRALFVGICIIVIWQAVIVVFDPPPFMLPGPERVFDALRERPDLWRVHAVTTLIESLLTAVTVPPFFAITPRPGE